MTSKFESQQNKKILWDLLYTEKAFDKISPEKKNQVKDIFDECFVIIEKNRPNDILINKNKMVISHMIEHLQKIKENTNHLSESNNITEFEKNVEKHKLDLQQQMNPMPPSKPIFSEGIDQPLGKEMDSILNNMIKNRNLDIKSISNNWINPNINSKKSFKNKLQIKNIISLPENSIQVISVPQANKKTLDSIPMQRRNIGKNASGGVLPDIQKELGNIKKRLDCLEKNKIKVLENLSPYI